MKKKKRPFEVASQAKKGKTKKPANSAANRSHSPALSNAKKKKLGFFADPGVRETIESIVVAVILALLFRAYEAEAFVIPTGSMAPTLQGRHVDMVCKECGHNFRVGASGENPDRKPMRASASGKIEVDPDYEWYTGTATCPICRYTHKLKRNFTGWKSNQDSFYGDRILVSKFAYEMSEPNRWDVIVFKYPANPKQNYIKRLIGLPGETIKLEFGNVYVRNENGGFDIARKPHNKLKVMLQLVDDTHHIAESLKKVNWPSRWDQWDNSDQTKSWSINAAGKNPRFSLSQTEDTKWLRYKHLVPSAKDWLDHIENNELPPRLENFQGQLIGDFYTYNFFVPKKLRQPMSVEDWMELSINEDGRYLSAKAGVHWVNDLAVECVANVQSATGELKLDLVRSGIHFNCSIDIESGLATLSSDSSKISFVSKDENVAKSPAGKTPVRGKGSYRIRYANCDDKLYLWVNEKVIQFDGPTEYVNIQDVHPAPKFSTSDPGDAQPIGIGGTNIDLTIERLKVFRDVFYINSRTGSGYLEYEYKDYPTNFYANSYEYSIHRSNVQSLPIRRIFEDPALWNSEEALNFFSSQIHSSPDYFYPLEEDQFMPLGDNSPSSQDARAWDSHYFERKHLIGKALFIYWPHAWRQPFFFPNFKRMGFIR